MKDDKYRKRLETIVAEEIGWKKLKNKTIVVSGATGMIGKMLIDVLLLKNELNHINCKIVAVGRNKEKARKRFGEAFRRDDFEFIETNINQDVSQIKKADYILHLASATHPKQYATEPVETVITNVIGLNNLLKKTVELRAERFLFTSSVEIYGENRGGVEKFNEEDMGYINCNTLRAGYPEGKRVGEALCQAYKEQYGLNFVVARLARVFGPTMLTADSKASSQFIKNVLQNEDIVLKSNGLQKYSYLYVADAVRGILYVLLNGESGEAYNVADDEFNVTLKRFAEICAEIARKKVVFNIPSEDESKGFSRATVALMGSDKIRGIGFRVSNKLKDCIVETIEIIKE